MGRRTAILILITALLASACTGSDVDEPIPAPESGTTTTISTSSTDGADNPSSTASPASSDPVNAFNDTAIASSWPLAVTLWDASGARWLPIQDLFSSAG